MESHSNMRRLSWKYILTSEVVQKMSRKFILTSEGSRGQTNSF